MVTSESEHPVIFTKGTEIEVTSDEDGFRGAWYRATLVESPPKSASKKRKKVLVEYKYLLADDGTSPLTEYVDPAYVRPLPPQKTTEKKPFELNDLVDANYRDGWWTGTVRKILDDGKLRVCFDNPPDVLDFEEKDLRLSWVWVNGNWVRPKKLQSTGSVFSPGTAVEVNPDELENLRDVWFPAIIIKENEDGTFFVKYENKMIGDEPGMVKVNLDSKHIRPTPPRYVDKNYELLEKVDTSYGFGWRAGVITKVLPEGRYNVFFKHGNVDKEFSHSELRPHLEWTDGKWISKSKEILIASGNQEQLGHACTSANNPEQALKFVSSSSAKDNSEDKTPNFTNIRNNQMKQSSPCHEDFTSYSFPSKKKIKLSDSNGSIMRSRPNRMLTERNVSETSSHIKEMPNETEDKQSDFMSKKAESTGTRRLKKPVMADQPPAKIESPYLGKRIKTKQQKFGADFQTIDLVKRKGRPTKFHVKMSPAAATGKETDTEVANAEELNENDRKEEEVETRVILGLKASKGVRGTQARNSVQISKNESLKLIRDQKKNINDSEGDNSTPRVGGSSQRRKRGRPRKLVITSPGAPEDGKDHKRAGVAADEIGVKDHVTSETELHTLRRVESAVSRDISGERVAQVSEIDSSIKEVDMAIAVVSNNPTDDDQPLSTWIGGMHSTSVEELRLSSGRTANGLNEARERQIDRVTESSANHNKNGTTPVENEVLPFVKKSTIWSTIESMEVFQIVPQNPHFHPLCETKEEYREGSAIGIMVTFAESPMSLLPEACIAAIISCTTPPDACRLSLVSPIFKSAAESDVVWECFLPPGYQSIISNSSPCPSSSSSPPSLQCLRPKKKLFLSLCDHPILIDDGKKAFYLDKRSGKKCYMIFARELMIVWGNTPEYWARSSLPGATFQEVAVLIDVRRLDIRGKISTCILTPGTHYTAFLVFKLMAESYGFHYSPVEVSVGLVGSESQKGDVYLDVVTERRDNWLEVELGDFYNAGDGNDELEMSVLEVYGGVRRGELIVKGIDIRPKQGKHTSDLPC